MCVISSSRGGSGGQRPADEGETLKIKLQINQEERSSPVSLARLCCGSCGRISSSPARASAASRGSAEPARCSQQPAGSLCAPAQACHGQTVTAIEGVSPPPCRRPDRAAGPPVWLLPERTNSLRGGPAGQNPDLEETIATRMVNLCRCGTYPRIRAGILRAAMRLRSRLPERRPCSLGRLRRKLRRNRSEGGGHHDSLPPHAAQGLGGLTALCSLAVGRWRCPLPASSERAPLGRSATTASLPGSDQPLWLSCCAAEPPRWGRGC